MSQDELTDRQRAKLHRWFDGELEGDQLREVERLVESNPAAEQYLERLRELRHAATAAHREVASAAGEELDARAIAKAAFEAPPLEEEPLAELAPMLERYYDGEALRAEENAVERLRTARDDVEAYLRALEEIGASVRAADREALRRADLDGFADQIADRLDEQERGPELLHRYADGELDAGAQRRVEEWLEANESARDALSAIEAVGEAARLAEDEIRQRADLDDFWSGVDARLDEEAPPETGEPDSVVSLEAARDEKKGDSQTDVEESPGAVASAASTVVDGFSKYSQHLVGAAAAAVVLVAAAALLRPGLFQAQQPKKTVVIVDSVEYSSGSSVVVDSPMRQVRAKQKTSTESPEKEDKPTVIWLLDSNGEGASDDKDRPAEKVDGNDEPSEQADDDAGTGRSPDAGTPDTGGPHSGQPI